MERRSFRQAAAALGVAQSSVSRRISELEDALGVTLFTRHCGGIRSTEAGIEFFRYAQLALGHLEQGTISAGQLGRGELGLLRIGCCSPLGRGFLNSLLEIFSLKFPDVQIQIFRDSAINYAGSISHNAIDIAFIPDSSPSYGCESHILWKERTYAALYKSHKLNLSSDIFWKDLMGEKILLSIDAPGPDIGVALYEIFNEIGIVPDIQFNFVGRDLLFSMVGLGRGITITTESLTHTKFPNIIFKPISEHMTSFKAIWSRENMNPACQRFLGLARSLSRRESHE